MRSGESLDLANGAWLLMFIPSPDSIQLDLANGAWLLMQRYSIVRYTPDTYTQLQLSEYEDSIEKTGL